MLARPLRILFFCLPALLCFTTISAQSQTTAWPLDGPAFSAAPLDIVAAAAKVPAEPLTEATVLFEESRFAFDTSGRVTTRHRLVYRIETAAGIENWNEAAVAWEAFYQKQPSIRARVIDKSGHAVELDPATLTDVPARNQEEGTYSDGRIHKGPLPALAAGSIVEEETELVDTEPFFSGGGVYRVYLQQYVPVVRSRIVVETPRELSLAYRLTGLPSIATHKEEDGTVTRITFDQGHLDPIQSSDIDLATAEPRVPLVQFSTGKSWAAVAQSYRELSDPQLSATPNAVKPLLPALHDNRMATITALVERLHKEVRYTGIEFGQSKLQPQTPEQVMRRHYGDCKDKATLLVAMLRAAGIDADLALLNAGPGLDVTTDLPGMNQFDHAIVYVPAAGGESPLWIDATAEFSELNALPYADRGRLALIIAPGTTGLTTTPPASSQDNFLLEKRTFELAEYGPSHVVELSEPQGDVAATYRSLFGRAESKESRQELESYAHNQYLAKTLTKVDHGEGTDISKPFHLRLDIADAKRGFVSLDEAAVYILPVGLMNRLPRWFLEDPEPAGQKLTAEEEADRQKAEHARSSNYLVQPFVTEWHYDIIAPAGFTVRALPPATKTAMGPATLSEEYAEPKPGLVTATLRFDSGKVNYTLDDALALRKAMLAFMKTDAIGILFDQAGAKLLAQGKVREGFAADQKLIDQAPAKAINHARLAYALVRAGVGDKAHAEARKAVALEPKSAVAQASLGQVLQFNDIGVQYGRGFDLAGAKAAYAQAKQLDPEQTDNRVALAILDEFDTAGQNFTSGTDLTAAIAELRDLAKVDKNVAQQYEDNLLYALYYARHFEDLLKELATLPGSVSRNALTIAAVAASQGAPAGIARADQLSADAQQRGQELHLAGAALESINLYPQAADVLAAASSDGGDSARTSRQIEILRSMKPMEVLPASDPREPVQRMMLASMNASIDDALLTKVMARHAYTDAGWAASLKENEKANDIAYMLAKRTGTPVKVLGDIALDTMKLTVQGDEASGYRITQQSTGTALQHYFVVHETGGYRIAAANVELATVGNEALYLLDSGAEKEAQSLLDWRREQLHKGGGDDPLSGPLLPRLWTVGESSGPAAIRAAAASLLVWSDGIEKLLPGIAAQRAALPATADKEERANLDLVLAQGYLHAADSAHATASSRALLEEYPSSYVALRLAGRADRLSRDFAHWKTMLAAQMQKHPEDRELQLMQSQEAAAEGDFQGARKYLRGVLDGGHAEANDYNTYAWLALFEDKLNPSTMQDAIEAAQQANSLTHEGSFSVLHTLACLYAAEDKTGEARQALSTGMASALMATPIPAVWFALGSIYEQYGLPDSAAEAYRKVDKPDGVVDPDDTWVLAQRRLKAIGN